MDAVNDDTGSRVGVDQRRRGRDEFVDVRSSPRPASSPRVALPLAEARRPRRQQDSPAGSPLPPSPRPQLPRRYPVMLKKTSTETDTKLLASDQPRPKL